MKPSWAASTSNPCTMTGGHARAAVWSAEEVHLAPERPEGMSAACHSDGGGGGWGQRLAALSPRPKAHRQYRKQLELGNGAARGREAEGASTGGVQAQFASGAILAHAPVSQQHRHRADGGQQHGCTPLVHRELRACGLQNATHGLRRVYVASGGAICALDSPGSRKPEALAVPPARSVEPDPCMGASGVGPWVSMGRPSTWPSAAVEHLK